MRRPRVRAWIPPSPPGQTPLSGRDLSLQGEFEGGFFEEIYPTFLHTSITLARPRLRYG